MKPEERDEVLGAVQALDQFASNAPLSRQWHASWQGIFQQVVEKIQAMVEKPADKGKSPPD